MQAPSSPESPVKPVVLTQRIEEVLTAIHLYRYMTALDVAHLLYTPSTIARVRGVLSALAGGEDYRNSQYLYRFPLPGTAPGTKEKIYTLGSKGRDFLAHEIGLPVDWYFRPYKVKHLSYSPPHYP
jgi:hypothetical protein